MNRPGFVYLIYAVLSGTLLAVVAVLFALDVIGVGPFVAGVVLLGLVEAVMLLQYRRLQANRRRARAEDQFVDAPPTVSTLEETPPADPGYDPMDRFRGSDNS